MVVCIPVVVVDRTIQDLEVDTVVLDNVASAYRLTTPDYQAWQTCGAWLARATLFFALLNKGAQECRYTVYSFFSFSLSASNRDGIVSWGMSS
jgi:hypothetical protein